VRRSVPQLLLYSCFMQEIQHLVATLLTSFAIVSRRLHPITSEGFVVALWNSQHICIPSCLHFCPVCILTCSANPVLSSSCSMASGFFRGTSHEQDSRFKNKLEQQLKEMKFPEEYSLKVCLSMCLCFCVFFFCVYVCVCVCVCVCV
jgi:hypothetical protein